MRRIVLIGGVVVGAFGLGWGQVEVRRCVLDGQSRSIAIRLLMSKPGADSNAPWVSYSASTGSFMRCWSGVLPEGDFPVAKGPGHLSIPADKATWTIRAGDESRPILPRFVGYIANTDGVTLRYEIKTGPTERILIEETPSASQDSKTLILRRSFKLSGVPKDISLSVDVPLPTSAGSVETNGSLIDAKTAYPNSLQMAVKTLLLRPNATTFLNETLKPGSAPLPSQKMSAAAPHLPQHPGYLIATLNAPSFSTGIGDVDLFPNGDVAVCTHAGDVFRVSGWDKTAAVKVKKIASGLDDPRGLKIFGNYIYVLQREELTELVDTDRDGIYDEYRCVNQGWPSEGAAAGRSLGLISAGQLFHAVVRNGQLAELNVDGNAATKELPADILAIGTAPKGQRLFCVKNQVVFASGEPVVDLPQADHIGDIFPMPGTTGPYMGQILVSTDAHGLGRIFLDRVGSEVQGAFIPVIKNFSGRFKVSAKGTIVGGDRALHKLTPGGKTAFAIQSVRLREGGLEVWLTDSLAPGIGMDSSFYRADTTTGALSVGPIQMNKWRNRLFLPLGGLKAGQVIHVTLPSALNSMKNQPIWTQEFWYTARSLSSVTPFVDPSGPPAGAASPPRKAHSGPAPTLPQEPR